MMNLSYFPEAEASKIFLGCAFTTGAFQRRDVIIQAIHRAREGDRIAVFLWQAYPTLVKVEVNKDSDPDAIATALAAAIRGELAPMVGP